MTEPRIPLASPHGNPGELQALLDTLSRRGRPPLNIFLALANHPDLLRDFLPLGARLLLPARCPGATGNWSSCGPRGCAAASTSGASISGSRPGRD